MLNEPLNEQEFYYKTRSVKRESANRHVDL